MQTTHRISPTGTWDTNQHLLAVSYMNERTEPADELAVSREKTFQCGSIVCTLSHATAYFSGLYPIHSYF